MEIKTPKKLIEVALPLDAINIAAAAEKQPGIGAHPRGLHLWWARRPLAAARAVLFSQLVNDPGWDNKLRRGLKKKEAATERERLFELIKKLVLWQNTNNEEVLKEAREEIWKSWRETCELNKDHPQSKELFNPDKLPAFHDPFSGGGAIPLEAQRLGLESYASDLNPVSVIINKAMIEIPPKFSGQAPLGPIPHGERQSDLVNDWTGVKGLAEDVRRYGAWMRIEAEKRIGHLFPKISITEEMIQERPDLLPYRGVKLTVIAWLWSRTVKCPNPACGCEMPLLSSFELSSKKGKEAYLVPKHLNGKLEFDISLTLPEKISEIKSGFKRGMSGIFECIKCGSVTSRNYTAEQATSVGLGNIQTAIICEGKRGKVYLPARYGQLISVDDQKLDKSGLSFEMSPNPRDVWCRNFGLKTPADLFTPRQLIALLTFSDLISEVHQKILTDAQAGNSNLASDDTGLEAGGRGARAYADAVSIYLAFSVSRLADYNSSISTWKPSGEQVMQTFKRQTLPMTWDFPESNIFSDKAICWLNCVKYTANNLLSAASNSYRIPGRSVQADASNQSVSSDKIVSTDPPYYDNIGYADLSDFFYVWLRRCLKEYFPNLFATLTTPKSEELVALSYRHNGKDAAEKFFMDGMTQAMGRLAALSHPSYPVSIYYAFKSAETKEDGGTTSTGWSTFLEGVLKSGFSITGTWPMRTELSNRIISSGTNALASSIVLVCRKRGPSAETISRRDFIRELNAVLPDALLDMTTGAINSPVAPVDLSQAIIGPGMAIFSKYSAVLEADGSPMSVKTALQLINRFLAEDDFDHDTQFCLHWFESSGWSEGKFGEADVLARAKGTSVDGVKDSGVLEAGSGKVRLLKFAEYPKDWSPEKDQRTPVWEALHHMIRALQQDGESAAGTLLAKMPARAETMRQLAYRLYTLCERKGWAEDARAYNELITAWPQIEKESHVVGHVGTQKELDF